jgi:hypothetical protein
MVPLILLYLHAENSKYKMKHCSICLLVLVVLMGGCKEAKTSEPIIGVSTIPMKELALENLSSFRPTTSNWKVAGSVFSDYTVEQDLTSTEGSGVLVNQISESENNNLLTTWEHGDLELELEFMMPKGSNSGIYFQGRYEIQLFDSWKVPDPQYSDCGGIYQRWDENASEESQGFEGHPPAINACKAPGLWHQLYVKFTAPKFDSTGFKISNARFDKVVLNDLVIHENVTLSGPTRASVANDEVSQAPLMIQGDHGNVAFRNISYKRYFDQKVLLSELKFSYYHTEMSASLPKLDSLDPVEQGSVDSFAIDKIAKRENFFAIGFKGNIKIPTAGAYIFHTVSDDGSKLFIDEQLVVSNDFNHSMERQSGLIELTEGEHNLRVDYYNNQWGRGLAVFYEGPEIHYLPLNSFYNEDRNESHQPLKVVPGPTPELLRGFVNYKHEKRTHTISVGNSEGVHYSLDLRNGALLKSWRGEFVDVSNMWRNRGESQLAIPLALAVELSDGSIAAILSTSEAQYPTEPPPELRPLGYILDSQGHPTFQYKLEEAKIFDSYEISNDNERLERTISIEPDGVDDLYTRIATADYIELLQNGIYSIGGQFYLELLTSDPVPIIRKIDSEMELIFPVTVSSTIKYSLLW